MHLIDQLICPENQKEDEFKVKFTCLMCSGFARQIFEKPSKSTCNHVTCTMCVIRKFQVGQLPVNNCLLCGQPHLDYLKICQQYEKEVEKCKFKCHFASMGCLDTFTIKELDNQLLNNHQESCCLQLLKSKIPNEDYLLEFIARKITNIKYDVRSDVYYSEPINLLSVSTLNSSNFQFQIKLINYSLFWTRHLEIKMDNGSLDLKLVPYNTNAYSTKITVMTVNMLDKSRSYYTFDFKEESEMKHIFGIHNVSKMQFVLVETVHNSQVTELHI